MRLCSQFERSHHHKRFEICRKCVGTNLFQLSDWCKVSEGDFGSEGLRRSARYAQVSRQSSTNQRLQTFFFFLIKLIITVSQLGFAGPPDGNCNPHSSMCAWFARSGFHLSLLIHRGATNLESFPRPDRTRTLACALLYTPRLIPLVREDSDPFLQLC